MFPLITAYKYITFLCGLGVADMAGKPTPLLFMCAGGNSVPFARTLIPSWCAQQRQPTPHLVRSCLLACKDAAASMHTQMAGAAGQLVSLFNNSVKQQACRRKAHSRQGQVPNCCARDSALVSSTPDSTRRQGAEQSDQSHGRLYVFDKP